MFNVIFAVKNKRSPHLGNLGNILDFVLIMDGLLYIFTAYRGWRWDTFLGNLDNEQLGAKYWSNYQVSPINENAVLIVYGIAMWLRCFYQLNLLRPFIGLFAIVEKLFKTMITYGIVYFCILFLFSVIGFVLFYDLENFKELHTTLFTLFKATISDYNADQMKDAKIGAFLGYAFFLAFMIINLILIMNLIVARLASTYKKYNKRRHLLVHLNTLHVREISEADDKYSAMVSAPFPLNILHFFTAPILINQRKQTANLIILHLYYFPLALLSFATFAAYSLVILPFCYFKLIGHKFALMIVSPQGQGARSTLDRAGHALLFMALGPLILCLNFLVDLGWFIRHLYKMDLEKSNTGR
jgi:hypothetical protein